MAVAPTGMVDGRILPGRDFGTTDLSTVALKADQEMSPEKREDTTDNNTESQPGNKRNGKRKKRPY